MASSFLRFIDHTQRPITVSRTPLDEWSLRRRDRYLTTHNTHKKQTSNPPAWFEPAIPPSKGSHTHALDTAATGIVTRIIRIQVKEFRNRPGVAQRVPGGLGSQISMTFEAWRWWGRQPHAPDRLYPQEMFLVLIFTRGWVDLRAMVRSEGICHWKIQWHHRESIPGLSD